MRKDGGPAFPTEEYEKIPSDGPYDYYRKVGMSQGMSLRDYFAAKAMQGMMSNSNAKQEQIQSETVSRLSYVYADAMLKEREK